MAARTLPFTQVQDYLGEPVDGSDVVEFRLLYSGRVLGASRNNTRASVKHEIRREFHPQLRRLWETNKNLHYMVRKCGWEDETTKLLDAGRQEKDLLQYLREYPPAQREPLLTDQIKNLNKQLLEKRGEKDSFYEEGMKWLMGEWNRNGYSFIPLITEKFCLRCSLDILFLRPEEPGMLVNSGDIDGRVKTLFDALRMPKTLSESDETGPQANETPFYCLLEDDKLISEVRVTTDHLLLLPRERELNANDAMVVITVKVKPVSDSWYTWAFS